jgi:hypothetical protein
MTIFVIASWTVWMPSWARSGKEERITGALLADGGGGTVAGMDDGFVGELQKFLRQGFHDLFEGAAPKISAADAASEKSVTGEELRLRECHLTAILGEIEANAAGRVAGSVDDVGLEAAPVKSVPFPEQMVNVGDLGGLHADEGGLHFHGVVEREIVIVHHHGRAGVLVKLRETADVVNVRVGADDGFDLELVPAEKAEDAFDFVARVNDDGFAGLGIANDLAIALEQANGEPDMDHFPAGGAWRLKGCTHQVQYIIQ